MGQVAKEVDSVLRGVGEACEEASTPEGSAPSYFLAGTQPGVSGPVPCDFPSVHCREEGEFPHLCSEAWETGGICESLTRLPCLLCSHTASCKRMWRRLLSPWLELSQDNRLESGSAPARF